MNDPTLNRRGLKEAFTGKLLKAGKGAIEAIPFKYEIIFARKLNMQNSAMPIGFTAVTETIRTSDLLPFAQGDKVTLTGGRTLTVQGVEEYRDPKLEAMRLNSLKGYIITLEGGGK